MKRIGLWTAALPALVRSFAGPAVQTRVVQLPEGYPGRRIRIGLSIPHLPRHRRFEFSEHVVDASGVPGTRVLAASAGRLAISDDLGRSWREVGIARAGAARILHVKNLEDEEFLVQSAGASDSGKKGLVDLSVVNTKGEILAHFPGFSVRWHGCRSVGQADGTLMFAEYPQNKDRRWTSRVFRSRDRGRSWNTVFSQTGAQIRHFHFLQPRPGRRGEWWLTSGDHPHECRVWVSRDDGDTWIDLTSKLPDRIEADGKIFRRDVFRLTDLTWEEGAIVWGTDDTLQQIRGGLPEARMFRSPIADQLVPRQIGIGRWHFRSLVDIGSYYLLLSQGNPRGCALPDDLPGVYLAPKERSSGAPGMTHLFDVESLTPLPTKLTSSRASRASKDGIFFSLRGRADVFAFGHRVLQWDVGFE